MTVLRKWRLGAVWVHVGLALVMVGCGSTPVEDYSNKGAERLYADAKDDMESGAWDRAIKTLEKVEGRAAGTLLAQQAQIDLAYANWKSGERVQALSVLERFIKLNPSSPALDYAMYLRGLVNFNDNLGILGSLAGQELSERDQHASRDAYQSFKQLVEQFPDSKYSADAKVRMDYIVNSLAEYEVHVARYYFRRGAYVASASRAQQALTEFQGAPITEEALYLLVQSYDRLGLGNLRDDAQRVLDRTFPDSKFTKEGLKVKSKPWWQVW